MSEQPQPVLLDSNAYFRLAQSIHPLLHGSFGTAPRYTLCVLEELDDEYRTSSRLKNKFEWVGDAEYAQDREGKRHKVPRKKKKEADDALSFLTKYADGQGLNLSLEDLKALAVGFIEGIPVVSDDTGIQRVAQANGIECWPTMKLLKLMVNAGHINMDKVNEVLGYWEYENDLPMLKSKLRIVFKEYFGADCPI